MTLVPIVEGYGEVKALPLLLRRLQERTGNYSLSIASPIRSTVSDLTNPEKLAKRVAFARSQEDCAAIFILFDADDLCPRERAPELLEVARTAARGTPCELVVAYREFESWFLASFDSVRTVLRFKPDAQAPIHPESKRNAKGQLTERLIPGRAYSETIDQVKLTASFDIDEAYRASRSFRHCVDAFERLVACVGTGSAEDGKGSSV